MRYRDWRLFGVVLAMLLPAVAAPDGSLDAPLFEAVRQQQTERVRALLKSGADPNASETRGKVKNMPALSLAAHYGNVALMRLLVEAGARVNPTGTEYAPIDVAAAKGNTAAVVLLADNGAQIDVRNKLGSTPLLAAVFFGRNETAMELVRRGADVNAQESRGLSPLMFAAGKGNVSLVEYLLQHGADAHQRSKDGSTALDYAKVNKQDLTAELIRQHMRK